VTEISVEIQKKKYHILPYKWLFWWVFNFRFLREGVKCAKNEVPELLFPKFCGINKCIPFQDIFAKFCSRENKHLYGICFPFDKKRKYSRGISPHQKNWTVGPLWCKKKGVTTLLCQIFTVLAHRSTKMKLCVSRKHFIPNLSKPVTAAYSGETENTNFEFFGLTYKRRTKCWSLRLDISSRRQYLCTFTYAIMIFYWGGWGRASKIK
jgi:hypothetical protein